MGVQFRGMRQNIRGAIDRRQPIDIDETQEGDRQILRGGRFSDPHIGAIARIDDAEMRRLLVCRFKHFRNRQ